MAGMMLFLPALMLLGVRSRVGIGIFFGMVVIAAGISSHVTNRRERSAPLLYTNVFFDDVVFGLAAGLCGPLVLVPSMVITNTVRFALHLEGKLRQWAIGSACVTVALPVGLVVAGISPTSYLPPGDGILRRPLRIHPPPMATMRLVTASTLIAIIDGAFAVARVRDSLTVAERRLQMQRWQLQQLLSGQPCQTGSA